MEVKHRNRFGADLVAATIAFAMPGIVCALWLAPRPATPTEVPALALRGDEVRAAIEDEHALARRVPEGDSASRRRALSDEQNLAELRGGVDRERGEARRAALQAALDGIAAEHGDAAIAAVRAADVERMISALAEQGDDDERARAMGAFRRSLERWGAIDGDRRVAPEIVVRAMFAARWNAIHGRALTDGLGPVHLRAYHGWLALGAPQVPAAMRESALDAYRDAGGADGEEARGVLAWQAAALEEAESAFTRAYEETGVVRLRNHALAAALAREAAVD